MQLVTLPAALPGLFTAASTAVDEVDGVTLINAVSFSAASDWSASEATVEAPGDDTQEFPGDDLDPIDEPDSTPGDNQPRNRLFVPSILR